eukprot:scaffold13102_cov39-Attheya_sp.AAC.3
MAMGLGRGAFTGANCISRNGPHLEVTTRWWCRRFLRMLSKISMSICSSRNVTSFWLWKKPMWMANARTLTGASSMSTTSSGTMGWGLLRWRLLAAAGESGTSLSVIETCLTTMPISMMCVHSRLVMISATDWMVRRSARAAGASLNPLHRMIWSPGARSTAVYLASGLGCLVGTFVHPVEMPPFSVVVGGVSPAMDAGTVLRRRADTARSRFCRWFCWACCGEAAVGALSCVMGTGGLMDDFFVSGGAGGSFRVSGLRAAMLFSLVLRGVVDVHVVGVGEAVGEVVVVVFAVVGFCRSFRDVVVVGWIAALVCSDGALEAGQGEGIVLVLWGLRAVDDGGHGGWCALIDVGHVCGLGCLVRNVPWNVLWAFVGQIVCCWIVSRPRMLSLVVSLVWVGGNLVCVGGSCDSHCASCVQRVWGTEGCGGDSSLSIVRRGGCIARKRGRGEGIAKKRGYGERNRLACCS